MKDYYSNHKEERKLRDKEYYQKNKSKILRRQNEWKKNNPKKYKEKRKKEYQKHKEKIKQRARDWGKNNYNKLLKRNMEWARKNPSKKKAQQDRYKTKNPERFKLIRRKIDTKRKNKLDNKGIAISTQKKIFERDKRCVYCGDANNLTIDHIKPVDKCGTNDYTNLVVSCQTCNSSKGTKNVFKWCESKGYVVPKIVLRLLDAKNKQMRLKSCQ